MWLETESFSSLEAKYSSLRLNFSLARLHGYFIMDYYLPSILLVVISWVSFWLDPDMIPARVLLGTYLPLNCRFKRLNFPFFVFLPHRQTDRRDSGVGHKTQPKLTRTILSYEFVMNVVDPWNVMKRLNRDRSSKLELYLWLILVGCSWPQADNFSPMKISL